MGKRRSGKKRDGASAGNKPSLSLADLSGDVLEQIVAGFDTRERCMLFSSCKALWALSKTYAPLVSHVEVKLTLGQAPSLSSWLAARKDLVEWLSLVEASDSSNNDVHAAALALLQRSLAGGALHTLLWHIQSGAQALTLGDLGLDKVRRLHLSYGGFHWGNARLMFAASFSRLTSLESLHIDNFGTDATLGPRCLPASLTSLVLIDSSYKAVPRALLQAPQLRQLEFGMMGRAEGLGGLSQLTQLNFCVSAEDNDPASICTGVTSGLRRLTGLHSLQLDGLESLTNLEALAHMPGLTSLALVACCESLDYAPPLLSTLTSLQALEVSCQSMTGDGGLGAVASLTRLARLVLADNSGLQLLPAGLTCLTNLQVLSIWLAPELDPGEAGVGRVGQLASLRKLRLSECRLSRIPNSVWALPRLEVLDVSANRRDDAFTAQSSQRQPWAIPLPPATQHLTALHIDFVQAAHNPEYLRSLTSLQQLYLQDIFFDESAESSEEEAEWDEPSDYEEEDDPWAEESSEEEGGFGWAAGLGGVGGGGQGQEVGEGQESDEESSDESGGSEGWGDWSDEEGWESEVEGVLQGLPWAPWGQIESAGLEEDAKHIAPHHLEMLGAICSMPSLVILDAENWEQLDRLFQAAAPRFGAARERLRANLAAAARARASQWPPAESGEGLVEDPDLRDHSGM